MDRSAWIMAAWIIRRHGADAFAFVEQRIAESERDHASRDLLAAEYQQLGFWCETGRAVLDLLRERPEANEAVH